MRIGNTPSGDPNTEWLNVPAGRYQLSVAKFEDAPPSPNYPDSARVKLQLLIDPDQYKRAKAKLNPTPEQAVGQYVNEFFGATIGHPDKRTRLFARLTSFLGTYADQLTRWADAGNDIDLDWFTNLEVEGMLVHTVNKGKTYLNIQVLMAPADDGAENWSKLSGEMRRIYPSEYAALFGAANRPRPVAAPATMPPPDAADDNASVPF